MTVIVAESFSGTGDLGAVSTNETGCGYPTPTAEPVSDTVGVARPERSVGQSDPAGPPRRATNAELTARFERDVIPLRAPLYRRAMRLTRNRADAENLLQENESLILLDWEYAHVADPLWDLAGWSANNDLEADVQWGLLTRYLGSAPDPGRWQRFRSLLWLYDYVCLLWSQLYLDLRREAADGIAERARLLDARLHLPAHYAA